MPEETKNLTLSQVRDAYFEKRWEVRRKIIKELKKFSDNRFNIYNEGAVKFNKKDLRGHGSSEYANVDPVTKKDTIADFDLSGWQWITVNKGFSQLSIDLQAFDTDGKSGARHVLDGRIQFRCKNPKLYVVTQFDVYSLTEEQISGPDGLIEQFGKFYDITEELRKPLLWEADPQLSGNKPGQWQWGIHHDSPWL
jgi:hypothetical protein